MNTIKTWTPTSLDTFEQCRFRAKLRNIDKIPEPERPPLPAGKEYPNDRGTRVHDETDLYVKGTSDALPVEAKHFVDEIQAAREWAAQGLVEAENLWAFSEDWNTVGSNDWKLHWGRLKIDLFVRLSPEEALVVDYKTGRRDGNELKHNDQTMIYGVAARARYPELQYVTTELWYFDQNDLAQRTYTAKQLDKLQRGVHRRAVEMTTTTSFPPNPSKHTCRFCPYKTGELGRSGVMGTGHCIMNPE